MNEETQLKLEIGHLYALAWRSRNVDTDDGVPEDILAEYRAVIKKYGRKEALHRISTQVMSIAQELVDKHWPQSMYEG
jgi:hypothetical protein